jgi:chromosomal replication initiator protein
MRCWQYRHDEMIRRLARYFHVMLSPKVVQTIVAKRFNLTRGQLLGPRRLPRIVLARHIAILLTLEMVRGASLSGVGLWFGRDHTTVLHARERMRRRIVTDRKFAKQVQDLRRIISAAAGSRARRA